MTGMDVAAGMEGLEEHERTDDEERMLHGRCHLFAAAMSDLTGYPISAMADAPCPTAIANWSWRESWRC